MQIALLNGVRTRAKDANSGDIGECTWSGYPVKAKVGEIRQYWSYIGESPQLPEGYENETLWHFNWKRLVNDNNCEVVFGDNREHRADIVGQGNTIIEIQKSPIDIRVVRERIEFYSNFTSDRIVWLVDATDYFKKTFDIEKDGKFFKVKWKNKRQWTYLIAQRLDCHLFLDINYSKNYLLKTWVKKGQIYCTFYKKTRFYDDYLKEIGSCNNHNEVLSVLSCPEKDKTIINSL